MKKLLIALAAVLVTAATYGQGQVSFNNFAADVNVPIMLGDTGHGPGADYSAQLYLSSAGSLTALTPATTFRPPGTGGGAIADRYVVPVTVDVPGVAGGSAASFVMRVWQTSLGSYDAFKAAGGAGESAAFTLTVGGGTITPPNLTTLTAFTVTPVVPEPTIIALGVLGASALLLRRRK